MISREKLDRSSDKDNLDRIRRNKIYFTSVLIGIDLKTERKLTGLNEKRIGPFV